MVAPAYLNEPGVAQILGKSRAWLKVSFHARIREQGEQITTALLAALLARIRLLRDREARR